AYDSNYGATNVRRNYNYKNAWTWKSTDVYFISLIQSYIYIYIYIYICHVAFTFISKGLERLQLASILITIAP
ncbi:MAG: hypothetical protein N7Q72_06540, partial [Spiroplasma sp. Tabriz.8]|nr:hypothetical protein [Spiroplasma sp. Tabriz.8]